MSGTSPLYAGIEAGGTKFVLAVGTSPLDITARHVIPTREPGATLAQAGDWFAAQGAFGAMGIVTFGPADLDPASPTWGHIVKTPKPGWSGCDLAGYFAQRFAVPVRFDTDVNGAALAEARLGAGEGASTLAYVTVGTGIGVGLVIDGNPVHGIAHPEMGHAYPRRSSDDRDFAGVCPFHGDCFEGLASGPAIIARWGGSLSDLGSDHPAHDIVAEYLAHLCHTLFAATACEVVVMGGGVLQAAGLIDRIRARATQLDAGYLPGGTRHRIEAPGLGIHSGIAGALMLAIEGGS